jgi:O-antigen ligase
LPVKTRHNQKFFGSFFQKRTFLLPLTPAIAGPTGLGIAAAACAILAGSLEGKAQLAAFALACAAALGLILPRQGKALAILAVFIFGISLKMNKTFFLEEFSQWQYVPFAGGAAGITIGLNDIAALVLLAGGLGRPMQGRPVQGRPQPVWILISGPLLFMTAGFASLYNAGDRSLVVFELWRQALLLLSMLAAMRLSEEQIRTVLRLLAASIVLQGLIACIQFMTGKDIGLGFLGEQAIVEEQIGFAYKARAVGTIGHSNILAYFFEISLPLMLAMLLTVRGVHERLIYLCALGAGLAGVLATLSRAAWIAVPLTMLPVFLHFYGRRLWRLRTAVFGMGLLVLGSVALVIAWPTISDRLFSDDAGSADARAPLNEAALSLIEQFPMFGVGLNNLGNAFPLYDTTHNARVLGPINHVVHNLYLYVMAEVGIVGFLAFLWSFAAALALGWLMRRSPDTLARAIGVGGAAGLLAHLIHGLFDPGFRLSLPVSTLIAVQTGLIGAAWLRHRAALGAASDAGIVEQESRSKREVLRPRGLSHVRAYR